MGNAILLAVALQRYASIPPLALVLRDLASDLAQARNAPLTVLSVHTQVDQMPEKEGTEAKMALLVEPLVKKDLSLDFIVREGNPRELIQEVAREIGAQLIIMGTHMKREFFNTPLGGTAKAVIKNAPCRVLLLPPTAEESKETRELIIAAYPYVFPYG